MIGSKVHHGLTNRERFDPTLHGTRDPGAKKPHPHRFADLVELLPKKRVLARCVDALKFHVVHGGVRLKIRFQEGTRLCSAPGANAKLFRGCAERPQQSSGSLCATAQILEAPKLLTDPILRGLRQLNALAFAGDERFAHKLVERRAQQLRGEHIER